MDYKLAQKVVRENGIKYLKHYLRVRMEYGLPCWPSINYAQEWKGWYDFVGRENFPTYEEAKRIVLENGIKTQEQYISSLMELGLPEQPDSCYKNLGWNGWSSFFFPTYEEAKMIVKEKGIKTFRQYLSSYKELGLPSEPNVYYKDNWTDWYDFLGKEGFPEYKEAKRLVKESAVKTQEQYLSSCKELGLPANPNVYYNDKGWTNWYDFLGKEKADYPEYEKAKKVVKKKGIKTKMEYLSSYKDLGLPSAPDLYYKDKGWTDWFAFLGKEKAGYPEYEEAKKVVKEKGIKTKREYVSLCKELGLPSAPNLYYDEKGWTDWFDFLGKGGFPSYEDAKRLVAENDIKSKQDYKSSFKELGLPSNPQVYYREQGWNGWDDFFGLAVEKK